MIEGRPGRLAVELNNVEIRDNIKTGSSDNGAGLRIQVSGDGADTGGVPFGPLVEIDNDSAIVSNSTASRGGGYVQTEISTMEPGQQVSFTRSAELANPGIDQEFQYVITATESMFNLDLNGANNSLELDLKTGLFADGFE